MGREEKREAYANAAYRRRTSRTRRAGGTRSDGGSAHDEEVHRKDVGAVSRSDRGEAPPKV